MLGWQGQGLMFDAVFKISSSIKFLSWKMMRWMRTNNMESFLFKKSRLSQVLRMKLWNNEFEVKRGRGHIARLLEHSNQNKRQGRSTKRERERDQSLFVSPWANTIFGFQGLGSQLTIPSLCFYPNPKRCSCILFKILSPAKMWVSEASLAFSWGHTPQTEMNNFNFPNFLSHKFVRCLQFSSSDWL